MDSLNFQVYFIGDWHTNFPSFYVSWVVPHEILTFHWFFKTFYRVFMDKKISSDSCHTKVCLTNHMGSKLCHIMPLVITSLGGRHTHTHCLQTRSISRNHARAGLWPVHAQFKKWLPVKVKVSTLKDCKTRVGEPIKLKFTTMILYNIKGILVL